MDEIKYGGFWFRAAALLLDQMIVGFALSLLMILFFVITAFGSAGSISNSISTMQTDLENGVTVTIENEDGVQETRQLSEDEIIANAINDSPIIEKINFLFGPLYYIFYILVSIIYHASCEASKFQGSLAKLALGLKVLKKDGSNISFGRAFMRNLMAWVLGIFTLGISHLIAGWNKRRRALHDMVAGTIVIKKTPAF